MNIDCSQHYIVMSQHETQKVRQEKAIKCLCEIAMQERSFRRALLVLTLWLLLVDI
jgi:hypothetical protein